jgi:hypothetical protein
MGLTALTLEVARPVAPERRESVKFLVDSGAVYSCGDLMSLPMVIGRRSASVRPTQESA